MQNIRVLPAVHLYSISIETNAAQEVGESRLRSKAVQVIGFTLKVLMNSAATEYLFLPPKRRRLCHLVLA
jgi:hypothetical protein